MMDRPTTFKANMRAGDERGDYIGVPIELQEELERKTMEREAQKRVHVVCHGCERQIRLLLVVEQFRFVFYLIFILIVVIGIILTKIFQKGDYGKPLRDAFGVVSICVYFDYPPSSYVLPSIWAIALIFIYGYAIVSVFRVWVAQEEGKVSQRSFILYVVGFLYVILSFIVFTTIFAVQPDPKHPSTIKVHTAPYTNLSVGMWVLAVLVTWFGEKVAWTDIGLPKLFFYFNRLMVLIQSLTVIGKIIHHINCLVNLDNGLWWDPNKSMGLTMLFQVLDYLFLATVVAWPTLQSGFLTYKRHQTHCVYLFLEDNRESCLHDVVIENQLTKSE